MYNQDKFIEILKKCQGNMSLNEYAKRSDVDVGYLWRILNKKKTNPPTPKILEKIASSSNGVTDYLQLMNICGYLNFSDFYKKEFEIMKKQLLELKLDNESIDEIFDVLKSYDETHDEHDDKINCLLKKYPKAKKIIMDFIVKEDTMLEEFLEPINSQSPISKSLENFVMAYHRDENLQKNIDGLTPEEISDAVKFYKEMKNKINKDNNT